MPSHDHRIHSFLSLYWNSRFFINHCIFDRVISVLWIICCPSPIPSSSLRRFQNILVERTTNRYFHTRVTEKNCLSRTRKYASNQNWIYIRYQTRLRKTGTTNVNLCSLVSLSVVDSSQVVHLHQRLVCVELSLFSS